MSTSTDTSTPERAPASAVAQATVAVLMGGRSSERDVSFSSSRAVLDALVPSPGESDDRGPKRVVPVEIEPDGRWTFAGETLAPAAALAALDDVDLWFLGLHGGEGEGGVLQGLFRAAERPFTGSDVGASALCLDKTNTRLVVGAHGLATPRAAAVTPEGWRELAPQVLGALEGWETGWVVKPRRGGSSLGMSVLRDAAGLGDAIELAMENGDDALVEELVEGIEATVAVLGNPQGDLRAFTPVEIRPHEGRFFDYEEKYSEAGAEELCPPESLDEATCEELRQLALRAYRALDCEGYARMDFIVPPEGPPAFLEANTLPGLTPRSLLPLAAASDGLDFRSLCLEILRLALEAKRSPL